MKHLIILFLSAITIYANTQDIVSPNKNIKVKLEIETSKADTVRYKVFYKINNEYKTVIQSSNLGILRNDSKFDKLTLVKESETKLTQEDYYMICGKRKHCINKGSEKTFTFKNENNQIVNIVFRAYNNGIAFRYEFPEKTDSSVLIYDELTSYSFQDSTIRWTQTNTEAYENFFPKSTTGKGINNNQNWWYPALFQTNNNVFLLISEANITKNHCASSLNNSENLNIYKLTYPEPRDNFNQKGALTKLPWFSPWRTVIIGELSDIVESTLITDLSEANKLEETDWIKPGAVSWIYWANNHGSKDYQKVVEYVDLAVKMNWAYVLIDWEWDVMSNGGNIEDAVKYANSKGIKPLMWYNSGVSWLEPTPVDRLLTAENRAKEFSWLNEIGVYGIKVDFFAGDQQDMMKYYIELLEDAAKYKLLINFHGATLPRGWARTYPNLMTTEAVYGAEWYNNKGDLTNRAAEHNTTLPFTRNVVGSMDYTPVTFSNSQHPHITSYAHELALSVVFESGLQHFADKPSTFYSIPEYAQDFLRNIPVAWDDTKLLDGYPAEKIIIARKKENIWYLGGLNGFNSSKTLSIDFSFLPKGNYEFNVIKDGDDIKSFKSETFTVSNKDIIEINCLPAGGFVGTLIEK